MLDFRVAHRFGDMFGDDGGWTTFYGLENARDISIGFDYGVSDNLLVGINRTKGAGPLRMLVNSYIKYKIAGQDDTSETPLAVSVVAMNSLSTMPRSDEVSAINNFPKFAHRLTYHFQMMVSKRFSEVVSLQFNVGYTHRNFVDLDDVNYRSACRRCRQVSIESTSGFAGRWLICRPDLEILTINMRLPWVSVWNGKPVEATYFKLILPILVV